MSKPSGDANEPILGMVANMLAFSFSDDGWFDSLLNWRISLSALQLLILLLVFMAVMPYLVGGFYYCLTR